MADPKPKKPKPKKKYSGPRGPKLSLTRAMVDEAAAIVAKGNFRYVARGRMGVCSSTWNRWMERGREELREYTAGRKPKSKLTLKAELVMALDKAEQVVHSQIIEDVLESDNLKLKTEYLYRRFSKLYSKNPNAHDDETGETYKVDPMELLLEKLQPFCRGGDDDE